MSCRTISLFWKVGDNYFLTAVLLLCCMPTSFLKGMEEEEPRVRRLVRSFSTVFFKPENKNKKEKTQSPGSFEKFDVKRVTKSKSNDPIIHEYLLANEHDEPNKPVKKKKKTRKPSSASGGRKRAKSVSVRRLKKESKIASRSADSLPLPPLLVTPKRPKKKVRKPSNTLDKLDGLESPAVRRLKKENKFVSRSADSLSLLPIATKTVRKKKKEQETGDLLLDACEVLEGAKDKPAHKIGRKDKKVSRSADDVFKIKSSKKQAKNIKKQTEELFKAIESNDSCRTRSALENGADVAAQDLKTGNTVLIQAVLNIAKHKNKKGKIDKAIAIFRLLLQTGDNSEKIDFKAENNDGKTAVLLAQSNGMLRVQFILQQLISLGTSSSRAKRYRLAISPQSGGDGLRVTTIRAEPATDDQGGKDEEL